MLKIDIKNLKTAKRYAIALIETSKSNLDEIESDLYSINEIIFENESLKAFFLHPVISLNDKKQTFIEAFQGKINQKTFNFILNLLDENRLNIFPSILELYKQVSNKLKNILPIEVISAIELDNSQKEKLSAKLEEKLQKNANITYTIDNSILGGLVVKYEDNIVDLSLRKKFENLKKQVI